MKKTAFAVVGAASIALAGCGGNNEDSVVDAENIDSNADLNALADNAAAVAAEAEALGNQLNQLDQEAEANAAANEADATETAADENVSGM